MTTSERRRLRDLAECDDPEKVRAALLSLAGPRRTVKAAKKERLAAVKSKRETAAANRSRVRELAVVRDAGRCVVCGFGATEMHHLVGRHREQIGTVAMLCKHCHNLAHGGALHALVSLREWALRYHYTAAANAMQHRIDKVYEARAPRAAGAQP